VTSITSANIPQNNSAAVSICAALDTGSNSAAGAVIYPRNWGGGVSCQPALPSAKAASSWVPVARPIGQAFERGSYSAPCVAPTSNSSESATSATTSARNI
jgi:hypothetical protein